MRFFIESSKLKINMRYYLSQENFYTQKAKEEGYPARSVYKLQEIDRKFGIFQEGNAVLDLGGAPGSWLLYISKKVGPNGRVIGVDTEELKIELPANAIFIKKSVFDKDFLDTLIRCCHPEASSNEPKDLARDSSVAWSDLRMTQQYSIFQVVVSDLAPGTTGLHEKDVADCLELTQRAFEIAGQTLEAGDNFVCKLFEGPGVDDFIKQVKEKFKVVKRYRPQAIRKGSREFYLVAKDFIHSVP